MLQRRQQYKSRGTRQRMAAAKLFVKRPGLGTTMRRALPISTNVSANTFFKHARGIQKETGYVDIAATTYNYDTTGSIAQINIVAQGAGVTQRVGKKIIMKSLQIRGNHFAGSTGTVAEGAMLIVYDKRPTGALPNITDILNTVSPNSFNNDANAGRFRIIRRRDIVFTGNTATPATGNEMFDASDFIDLKGQSVVYKAAGTGAIGDVEEGALYVVTVGDKVAGTTAGAAALTFRLRFVDV